MRRHLRGPFLSGRMNESAGNGKEDAETPRNVKHDLDAVEGVVEPDNSIEGSRWSSSAELVPDTLAPSWTLSPFILGSYRKKSTFREAFASIFAWHNETGNIMTHLVGLIIFMGLLVRDLFVRNLPPHHRIIHGAMLIAAQYCMGSSTVYHIILPVSQRTSEIALNCDMGGIALCIVTIFAVGLHYAYWCHEDLGHMYLCIVGVLSVVLVVLPNVQAFQRLHRHAIPFLYFGFVVFALVPLVHWVILVGGPFSVLGQLWFFRILSAGISLMVGFFFWATRFPESKWPGKFDFFCQSHQIWHIFVFVSICFFYDAMTRFAEFRIEHSCGGIGHRKD